MKRVKIGDAFSMQCEEGLVLGQFIHKNPELGILVQIFRGFFQVKPEDLLEVISAEPQFVTFFPLQTAVNLGIAAVLGNGPVRTSFREFPIFRGGNPRPGTVKVTNWWLWDGDREWRVGELTEEQKSWPLREIVNDAIIVDRVRSGWTAATDPSTS